MTDKIPSRYDVTYENPAISVALSEYGASVPIPKMMQTSNFWAQLEIAFTRIWTGSDVNEILSALDERIKKQV